MVAISMADGWARVTGRPQAVIVHVDVGTQALGCGIHNASAGRAPVLIFAGLCPVTEDGELTGSRTEYQHWIQDAPDQKAIVRQYCRYVGELRTGRMVKQTVARAVQFATSDPKGPVYLTGAREVMAEEIEPYELDQTGYCEIGRAALPASAVSEIAEALVNAENPLIITGYSGRNHANPAQLVQLTETIPGLRVFDTGGSDMCFPLTHSAALGFRFSFDKATTEADIILILDCDVPWIPSRNPPRAGARIYHIDVDPLNVMMPNSHFIAHGRWKADSHYALTQLNTYLQSNKALIHKLKNPKYAERKQRQEDKHTTRLDSFAALAAPRPSGTMTAHHVGAAIKFSVPPDTVYVVEAVTSAVAIADQLQTSLPSSWINCGGAGLGWSGGAALGVRLALEASGHPKFVCAIVGDGTFLFSIPGSVYWVAARYGIPVLTVVLNNKGTVAIPLPIPHISNAGNDDIF
jgi:thiamine pyrophosphate-dependent acetolactate synthase large subunit-like protein